MFELNARNITKIEIKCNVDLTTYLSIKFNIESKTHLIFQYNFFKPFEVLEFYKIK